MSTMQKPLQPEYKALRRKDVRGVAEFIQSNQCKNIIVMLGAGVSTAAGIPDFRSPETGLYANLARLRLPYPEAVFEINYFRRNPLPFYTLANELYPGKYRPTLTHSFLKLLSKKNLLGRCFTQNIDTLELRAGVPPDKVIHAHGSFASQRCIDCEEPYDEVKIKEHIMKKEIPHCEQCSGLVKPDIVFFGESLPEEFIRSVPEVGSADLLIVIGTSLTVHPFASLATMTHPSCPRVLINMESVGDFGRRPDDVMLLGKCDDKVRELAYELGWGMQLETLWEQTNLFANELTPDIAIAAEKAATADLTPQATTDTVDELAQMIARDLNVGPDETVQSSAEPKQDNVEKAKVKAPPTSASSTTEVELIQGEKPSSDVIQKLATDSSGRP